MTGAKARGAAKTRGAAKADAKLAVKSKAVEKRGKAGKDPVKGGSKGEAAKTVNDLFGGQAGRDPNMPKRPPSAFYMFQEDFRKQLKEQNSGRMSILAFGKAVGDRWKALGERGQATYKANAKQQLQEFKKAMAVYRGEIPPASEEEEGDNVIIVDDDEDKDDDE